MEEQHVEDDDVSGGRVAVKVIEGLNERGPPPFLKNLFDIVDDAETDSLISWSDSCRSFIVWDPYKFSENLLPKYFKHNNFSSFVGQLNTYGFEKINSDRWEYATAGFQKGQKDLLKKIRRRIKNKESELEKLKDDCNLLTKEIIKVKEELEKTQNKIAADEERLRMTELRHLKTLILIAKVSGCPITLHALLERTDLASSGDVSKRQRVVGPKPATVGEEDRRESNILWDLMEDENFEETGGEISKDQSKIFLEFEELITNPKSRS